MVSQIHGIALLALTLLSLLLLVGGGKALVTPALFGLLDRQRRAKAEAKILTEAREYAAHLPSSVGEDVQ